MSFIFLLVTQRTVNNDTVKDISVVFTVLHSVN